MLEKGGHWGRHYMAPQAGNCRLTWWDKVKMLLRGDTEGFQRAIGKPFGRLRRGENLDDKGRRAIVPGMPIDNHAAGWYPATLPGEPKVSKERSESPFVASAEAKSCAYQEGMKWHE